MKPEENRSKNDSLFYMPNNDMLIFLKLQFQERRDVGSTRDLALFNNNARNFGPNVDWKNGQNKNCIKK